MARYKKWGDIAAILKERILNGTLKPGQEFPSTIELIKEFDVHTHTIQNAINSLIKDGYIMTYGSGIKRRIVRPVMERSVRRGGFLTEHVQDATIEILELYFARGYINLPADVQRVMMPPVLIYRTLQKRNNIPVAVSNSYIPGPGSLPAVKQLKKLITDPTVELYTAMEELGLRPAICEESLIACPPEPEDYKLLNLPTQSSIPVVKITRRVYDPDGTLLEICHLSDRSDCYEFVYRFDLKGF